jgi:hypothetical protein
MHELWRFTVSLPARRLERYGMAQWSTRPALVGSQRLLSYTDTEKKKVHNLYPTKITFAVAHTNDQGPIRLIENRRWD